MKQDVCLLRGEVGVGGGVVSPEQDWGCECVAGIQVWSALETPQQNPFQLLDNQLLRPLGSPAPKCPICLQRQHLPSPRH